MKHLSGLNNLTGLTFLLQSIFTEMLLRRVLLVNITMWRPAWYQLAGDRALGAWWSRRGRGKGARKHTFGGNANFPCLWSARLLVFRACWPIVCDSSLLSRTHGRWLTFALAFWRKNLLPTT